MSVWTPVPGAEGYEVTEWGRLRSTDRTVVTSHGVTRKLRGRELNPHLGVRGYLIVQLLRRSTPVHVVVAKTFHGPRPFAGAEVRHLNGDPVDNWVGNLAWGTHRENSLDTIRHGRNVNTQRTRCPLDHPLAPPNLDPSQLKLGRRSCLACHKAHARNYKLRITGRALVDHKTLADHYFAQLDMEDAS